METCTEEQVLFARRAMRIAMRVCTGVRPLRSEVAIGGVFTSRGVKYRCIRRPSRLEVSDACAGCAFLRASCPNARCSRFDRSDGENVWFEEVKDA